MIEDKGFIYKLLRSFRFLVPTEYIRTKFYLNLVYKPRKFVRKLAGKFYRIDHVYEILSECKNIKEENLSILEFGVADGYSFIKLLYATKYMGEDDRIDVHGFDTFEGLPEKEGIEDKTLMEEMEVWGEGEYEGRYEKLSNYCNKQYDNFELHKGKFGKTIDERLKNKILSEKPILIWIDCDYYSSTKSALVPIMSYIPTGCVIYFDDIDINYGSSLTGQMKMVREVNEGVYGDKYELVLDRNLSWNSERVYRFINLENEIMYTSNYSLEDDPVRNMDEGSPLP